MNRRLILCLVPTLLLIAGCSENYRYPCQDPENWGEKFCQKPYCSANGTCPEDLTHYEKNTTGGNNNQPVSKPMNKGGCS